MPLLIAQSRYPHFPAVGLLYVWSRPFRHNAMDQAVLDLLTRQRKLAAGRVAPFGMEREGNPIAQCKRLDSILGSDLVSMWPVTMIGLDANSGKPLTYHCDR